MKTQSLLAFVLFFNSIFLSAQPVLDWSKSYNGGSNLTDKLVAIAVDNDCNTIVTGQSDSIGTGIDIVTIKYDLDGNIIWKNRWDGQDHFDDIPTDLKVDQSGNIYLCGRTQGAATNFDYVTIKYTPSGTLASGTWPAIYNNNNANGNGVDQARSLCVNSTTGDVYVTGESYNHYSISSHEDVFNIRYNAQGTILDTVSGTNTSAGDFAKQIGIDMTGRIFVSSKQATGYIVTYDYDASLTLTGQWNNISNGVDFPTEYGIDQSNFKYIGFDAANGFDLVKISTTFSQWQNSFQRTGSSIDHVKSLATDNSGNSYVVASTSTTGSETDMWLLKVNTSGDTAWTKTWGSGNGADDVPVKIMYNSSPMGLIVIVNSMTTGGVSSINTLKFDGNGNLLTNYPLTFSSGTDVATSATKDSNGNIFIGGFNGGIGSEDYLTLKYRTSTYQVTVSDVIGDSLYITPAATSYQWYKDGIALLNEASQGINLDTPIYGNGNYFCKITQYCSTFYSDTVLMTGVSIPENLDIGEMISISLAEPNVVLVHYLENVEQGELSILDVQGRVVAHEQVKNILKGSSLAIPFSKKVGIYFLRFNTKRKAITKKFVLIQ